jgi:hypothetical protein
MLNRPVWLMLSLLPSIIVGGCAGSATAPSKVDPVQQYRLGVYMTGKGVVTHTTSLDGSVSCTTLDPYANPITCQRDFTPGTVVTLTASPQGGWSFQGWSGEGCSGTGSCVVTMSQARSVSATFR